MTIAIFPLYLTHIRVGPAGHVGPRYRESRTSSGGGAAQRHPDAHGGGMSEHFREPGGEVGATWVTHWWQAGGTLPDFFFGGSSVVQCQFMQWLRAWVATQILWKLKVFIIFFIPVLADEFPAFNPNGFIPNFVLALC